MNYELLETLVEMCSTIENIDGGCPECIDNTIKGFNEVLDKKSLKFVCKGELPSKIHVVNTKTGTEYFWIDEK